MPRLPCVTSPRVPRCPGGAQAVAGRSPGGDKVALADLDPGALARRHGQMIATASLAPSARGAHAHSHDPGMGDPRRHHVFGTECRALDPAPVPHPFQGDHRADRRVGTRNDLGVLTSVNGLGSGAHVIRRPGSPVFSTRFPLSAGSCPSPMAPAAGSPWARAARPCTGPFRTMRAPGVSAASCRWGWSARCCRSPIWWARAGCAPTPISAP